MPSVQVLDFGDSSEWASEFSKSFAKGFIENEKKRKNDEIFNKIKQAYANEPNPEKMYMDILKSEGMDESYKNDKLKTIIDYVKLQTDLDKSAYDKTMLKYKERELNIEEKSKTGRKAIDDYRDKMAEIREKQLDLQETRLNNLVEKGEKDLSKNIADYSSKLLKDSNVELSANDRAILNSRMESNMKDDRMDAATAFSEALEYVELKNEALEQTKLTARPDPFIGVPKPEELAEAMEKVYAEIDYVYEQGIESQKDLRMLLKRAGWKPDEIQKILQRLFQSKGRKVRRPQEEKAAPEQPEKGAGEPTQDMDKDEQRGYQILFGE
jgi:hypothetical protein